MYNSSVFAGRSTPLKLIILSVISKFVKKVNIISANVVIPIIRLNVRANFLSNKL
ncbi:MAG: hypothetical protein ACUVQT_01735 [bacterium]